MIENGPLSPPSERITLKCKDTKDPFTSLKTDNADNLSTDNLKGNFKNNSKTILEKIRYMLTYRETYRMTSIYLQWLLSLEQLKWLKRHLSYCNENVTVLLTTPQPLTKCFCFNHDNFI